MAIQKEIWQKDIQDALFADTTFIKYAQNVSDYVLGGKVVHLPQSAASTEHLGIEKNRTQLPASVKTRTDTEVTYQLDAYTTDPVRIPNAEQIELSYNKRDSVLRELKANLNEYVATGLLDAWTKDLPNTHILRTVSSTQVEASAPAATDKRKAFSEVDLQRAMTHLAKQRKSYTGTFVALVPYALMPQLMEVGTTNAIAQTWLSEQERRSGIVAKLQNFIIIPTPTRLVADDAGALKARSAAGTATDNEVVLCWESRAFEYALGSVQAFESIKDPLYYGDIYSFEVRFGGRRRRADNAGVVAIVQDKVGG